MLRLVYETAVLQLGCRLPEMRHFGPLWFPRSRQRNQKVMTQSCETIPIRSTPRPNQFVSRGNTFTSTRRLRLLCSALLGSVAPANGLSHPLPTTLNLLGSNLYFSMIAFRSESARS